MKVIILFFIGLFPVLSLALEDQDIDLIDNFDLIKTNIRLNLEANEDNSAKFDEQSFRFKGQERNTINWKELDSYEWLSFSQWAKDLKEKEASPAWRRRVKEQSYAEIMGRVLKCMGICIKYDGVNRSISEYRTRLKEGDEFVTDEGSAAWVILIDGTLLRLAGNTSITLNEVNISNDEVLTMIRLNKGFVHFRPRSTKLEEVLDKPETDLGFYPLPLLKANREFYMIKEYGEIQDPAQKLKYEILQNPGHLTQYAVLNKYIAKNNEFMQKKKSRFYIYSPNASIEAKDHGISMFYEPGSKAVVKIEPLPNVEEVSPAKIGLRGFNKKELLDLEENSWQEIDEDGRSISAHTQDVARLEAVEKFSSRIPSIMLAREIWISEYTKDIYKEEWDAKTLATEYGYRLWNENGDGEIDKRLAYVREYIRRLETSNLVGLKTLLKDIPKTGFTVRYYGKLMEKHYFALKKRFNEKNVWVKNMSMSEFYMWVLRNG